MQSTEKTEFRDLTANFGAAIGNGTMVAVVAEPGGKPRFFCSDSKERETHSREVFFAVPWLGKFADRLTIEDKISADEALLLADNGSLPSEPGACSTSISEYTRQLDTLIAEIRTSGGKTVFSRCISVDYSHKYKPKDIARLAMTILDEATDDSYRCAFFTPQCGLWVSASPEILVDYKAETKLLQTVALAGTRPSGTTAEWDIKNRLEQEMVAQFISDTLTGMDWQITRQHSNTRRAGLIEHIATDFDATPANSDAADITAVIDKLSPTPALCGEPRELSIERISRLESHQRRMYGGYFGVSNDERIFAAVTLRCAQLGAERCAIFAGGGITALSVAADEWCELNRKSESLLVSLRNAGIDTALSPEYKTS